MEQYLLIKSRFKERIIKRTYIEVGIIYAVSLSIILCLSLSPIWPLGDNPAGDPFIIVNKATNKLAYIDDGKIQKVFQ